MRLHRRKVRSVSALLVEHETDKALSQRVDGVTGFECYVFAQCGVRTGKGSLRVYIRQVFLGHNNDATHATRKHLIQDAAIRPKIRFVRIKVTLERLRRHVRGRAAVQVGVLHRLVGVPVEQTRHRQQHLTIKVVGDMKHPSQTEVADEWATFRVEKDIGRLQVPVYDTKAMKPFQ